MKKKLLPLLAVVMTLTFSIGAYGAEVSFASTDECGHEQGCDHYSQYGETLSRTGYEATLTIWNFTEFTADERYEILRSVHEQGKWHHAAKECLTRLAAGYCLVKTWDYYSCTTNGHSNCFIRIARSTEPTLCTSCW